MKSLKMLQMLAVGFVFILSGCTVRSYSVVKDRVDQSLSSGNRGYLSGSRPAGEEMARPTTRSTKVVEIELRSPLKFDKAKQAKAAAPAPVVEGQDYTGNQGYVTESSIPESIETESVPSQEFEKYTVQKNDTLQKISQKFYGTNKRYMKIFQANKDVLKAPDKIRPGQVLNIPVSSKGELKEEPMENLK